MRIVIKILFLVVGLFAGNLVGICADGGTTKESLMQKLETSKHDTIRLKTLCDLVDISKPEPKVRKYYAEKLLKEAELQQNNLYKCRAYLYHIFISYNENDREKLQKWLDLLMPLAQEEKLYDLMFQGEQCAIELLVLNEDYEKLEVEAQEMLRKAQSLNNKKGIVLAYQSIARAYRTTSRSEQAAEMLEQAYDLSLEVDDYVLSAEVNNTLIATYEYLRSYSDLLRCVQERERILHNVLQKQPELKQTLQMDFFNLYIAYAEYYLFVNDLQKAKEYMDLTDKYYSGSYYINKLRYHELNKSYFVATRQWKQALISIDSLITDYHDLYYIGYNKSLLEKADVLSEMNEYELALPFYKQALEQNDSILMSIYSKQVNFLKNTQTTEKKQLQTLRFRYYISLSLIFLIGAIIIVLFVFALFKYRINRELRQSEKQMRRISAEVEKVNKVKEAFISNMNNAIREPLNQVVDCSLDLASDKEVSLEEKKQASGVIAKKANELSMLINDILDLSRLEAGMMRFQVIDIAFNACLHDAIIAASADCRMQVDNKLSQDVNYMIRFDSSWLFRFMRCVFVPVKDAVEPLSVEVKEDVNNREIVVTVHNSVFVTPNPVQNIVIQTEMNRMLVEHFGGIWEVASGYVRFTIPIVSKV